MKYNEAGALGGFTSTNAWVQSYCIPQQAAFAHFEVRCGHRVFTFLTRSLRKQRCIPTGTLPPSSQMCEGLASQGPARSTWLSLSAVALCAVFKQLSIVNNACTQEWRWFCHSCPIPLLGIVVSSHHASFINQTYSKHAYREGKHPVEMLTSIWSVRNLVMHVKWKRLVLFL